MNLPAFISLGGILCYGGLMALVLRRGFRETGTVHRFFLLYLVFMTLWQCSALMVSLARDVQTALVWYVVMSAVVLGQFLAYSMFLRAFFSIHDHRLLPWIGLLLWVVSSLLVLLYRQYFILGVYWNERTDFYLPVFGPMTSLVAIPNYAFLVYAIYLLYQGYRRAGSALERIRIRYLFLGLAVVLGGTLANFVPLLKAYPVDLVANIVNAFLIAYAIFRFQLLDISVVIRKGLLYSIPTMAIGVAYFLALSFAYNWLHLTLGYQFFLLSVVLAIVTALAAQPFRDTLQGWLDRLFFREKYDSSLMLQRLSRTSATLLDIHKLTDMILDDIARTLHISAGAFYIKHEGSGQFALRAQRGLDGVAGIERRLRDDHPVAVWLRTYQTTLTRQQVDTSPGLVGLWARERKSLQLIGAELVVPLLARDYLTGILILGRKLSDLPYALDEQRTLMTLANQTAVAVENARLFSEMAAEKERTAAIVEHSFAGIVLLDSELRIVSLNPAAETIIGRDPEIVLGTPLRDVLGPGIVNGKSSLRKAVSTGERVAPREETLVVGDRRRDVLLGVTPLRDGYLLSLADVTQLKEVERLKSDIVANVSHEFRTPLAIIKAYTELLMEDDQGGDAASRQEYLAIIDAETNRLAAMVGQLLDLARLEADRGVIAMAPLGLGETVDEVAKLLQPQADARNIAVDICVPRDLPAVSANKELLTTLVRNLLDNAVKFSREGGKVEVVASRERDAIVLHVVDQGIGISEEDLPHLFEKFHRGSTAKEAGIRGTGLGLVLTKQAVEAHGGMIRVESKRGHGTRITVTLPLHDGTGTVSLDG